MSVVHRLRPAGWRLAGLCAGPASARFGWPGFGYIELSLEPLTRAKGLKRSHRAAVLTLDASAGLRAGDALHLASALYAKATTMATLDDVLARNAKRMKINPLEF